MSGRGALPSGELSDRWPTDRSARWSALHHDIDPAGVPLLRGWLRAMWWLAAPLVRLRVPPTAVTVLGAALAVGAAVLAGPAPWAALVLVVAAVLCDGLDGAVAVLADHASIVGRRADAIADRLADCAFAVVLWRCGAPWWLALLAGGLSLLLEGVRLVRRGALLSMITVAERPSRVVCTALACGCAAVSAATWPLLVCGWVWAGLTVVGLGQLGALVRRLAEAART